MDRVALDVHAEDRLGFRLGVGGVVGHLHAAGLASATGLDLRFHDHAAAEFFSDPARLARGRRHLSGGYRDAVLSEDFLRLMFEEVHEEVTLSVHAG